MIKGGYRPTVTVDIRTVALRISVERRVIFKF